MACNLWLDSQFQSIKILLKDGYENIINFLKMIEMFFCVH
jgi:hypothetical protein